MYNYGRRHTNESLRELFLEMVDRLPDAGYEDPNRSSLVGLAMLLFVVAVLTSFVLGVMIGVTYF